MSSNKERVFITGASGNIGSDIVRGLIKKQINTAAYVRDEQKAKDLFKDELNTGYLTIVVGTYASIDIFTKAIQGHTRLFLLYAGNFKPTLMSEVKGKFAKIAFEQSIRQIVDLSSATVSKGRDGIIGYIHTTAEEKLWTLVNENPQERSLVILRPAQFMSNHFRSDVHHLRRSNKLVSCGSASSIFTWIDTKDIADCAVVILSESIEKHDRMVDMMAAESLTNEERAAIFTKVLGRSIQYEQQSMEDFYNENIKFGLTHSLVYYFLSTLSNNQTISATPQLSIVLGRPLRSLEEWLLENAAAFQQTQ